MSSWLHDHNRIIICFVLIILGVPVGAIAAANRTIEIVPAGKSAQGKGGQYYALLIGNNHYKHLKNLLTAQNDARAVEKLLKEKFGFKTELLLDATRSEISRTFNRYVKRLKTDDSFLVYYAGHGIYDREGKKGYWLPVDAREEEDTNWIMADDITVKITRMDSRHVLIVADSCYSGTMTRAVSNRVGSRYLQKMYQKQSRTLMASGGNEPVMDTGGEDGHSVFASVFLQVMREIRKPFFTAEELFYSRKIKERVSGRAEQVPRYDYIKNSGHDGGDFVFVALNTFTGSSPISDIKFQPEPISTPKPVFAPNLEFGYRETDQNGNYISYDNGIVYDTKTGLEWYVGTDRGTTWDQAKKWVKNLTVAGGGWRMPNREELRSIYQESKGTRNMTPLLKTTGWWVWLDVAKGSSFWYFHFGKAGEYWRGSRNSDDDRGFAVRSRSKR